MKEIIVNGKAYKLPNSLNNFQQSMYIHLIDWKHKKITKEPGYYKYREQEIAYDAILPHRYIKSLEILYSPIRDKVRSHNKDFHFKLHKHFNHMASSQAANANLFLPVLLHPKVNSILSELKPDFDSLATDYLDNGFQIEFWGPRIGKGLLNDHNAFAGTDADIAISYYNKEQELCLWLVEHKLTEKEFTECGGYKSNRKKPCPTCDCNSSYIEILMNPGLCYYHEKCHYRYWGITKDNSSFFQNNNQLTSCPFKEGMNQLWRNQLLGLAIENDDSQPYKHVYFSVVKHPENVSLDGTIAAYKKLTSNNPKFTSFTSKDVIKTASRHQDNDLSKWVSWYRDLYNLDTLPM